MKEKSIKTIIFGDFDAAYHPLRGVDEILKLLLTDMDTTFTDDRNKLEGDILKEYNLCISYFDSWGQKLTQTQLGGLLSYVAQGGGLLLIHNGISYQGNPEFAQLAGAKFVGHPPYQKLDFKVSTEEAAHPIMEGVTDFVMDEELYTFEFDPLHEKTILLECTNNELTQPAAWVHNFGLGRVVYLSPGHDTKSFKNPQFQRLVQRSALWAAKAL